MAARASPATQLHLYLPSGTAVSLGKKLGSGGEGDIYELAGNSALVAKVYHIADRPNQRQKLEAMLASPVTIEANQGKMRICWPEDILLDRAGLLRGFIMPRVNDQTNLKAALFWDPQDRAKSAKDFTWRHLCLAASNIAELVFLIHEQGHVVGDLNEENFLISRAVNRSALVSLVDCDSMQIRDARTGSVFRSPVAREPYMSPEMFGQILQDVDRKYSDDCWALAVLIFGLLMEGQHPANGVGLPEERGKRIQAGIFPFFGYRGFEPPKYAMPLALLPPNLVALFQRCFVDGYSDPAKRPSATEWKTQLRLTVSQTVQCAEVGKHWHSLHLAACPWCADIKRIGIDRFADSFASPPPKPPLPPDPQEKPASMSNDSCGGTAAGCGCLILVLIFLVFLGKACR